MRNYCKLPTWVKLGTPISIIGICAPFGFAIYVYEKYNDPGAYNLAYYAVPFAIWLGACLAKVFPEGV